MQVVDAMALVPTSTIGAFANVPQTDIVITSAQETRAGSSASNAAVLHVDGLESGGTWQYTLDAGATWVAGFGSSLTVPTGSYAANAIQVRQTDAYGNSSGIGHFDTTLVAVDSTAPTVTTFNPGDDASKVAVDSNLQLNFSEPIAKGSGTITVKTLEGAVLESYDVATSNLVTISGGTLTLEPTVNLAYGTGYTVDIAPGAVQDLSGNAYAGGSNYNFTTTLVNPADPKSAYYEIGQKIFLAYFGRAADTGALANLSQQLYDSHAPTDLLALKDSYDTNPTVKAIIDTLGLSTESHNLYAGATTADMVTAIFHYMFNRAPAQAGLDFWVNGIDNDPHLNLAKAALAIMQGSENYPLDDGMTVAKKITVAQNFTSALDTPTEVSAYVGAAAAATVRTMLGGVGKTTDTGDYEPNVLATIATLVANHHTGVVGTQTLDFAAPADPLADIGPMDVALVGVDNYLFP
jgi:hypothetical protein